MEPDSDRDDRGEYRIVPPYPQIKQNASRKEARVMALKYEKSCGALVFRQDPKTGRMYILMIRHKHGGHRSFPKGHVEAGETEHQTAIREVEEETAVKIRITSDFCEKVHYSPMPGVQKEVVYFMAMTDQRATHPHDGEIADVEWVPLDNAERSLTHENDKIVLRAAMKALRESMV